MIKKTTRTLALALTLTTLFSTGCGFEVGDSTSLFSSGVVKYNNVDIFETVDAFDIAVKPLTYKHSSKKDDATLTFTFELTNNRSEKVSVSLSDFKGFDEDNALLDDVEFETKNAINLEAGESKQFELTISGNDADKLYGYSFILNDGNKKYNLEISDFESFNYKIIDVTKVNVPEESDVPQLEEEEEVTSPVTSTDYDITPFRTEWGNDEYGYVTLSDDWIPYQTVDADNSNILQYALKKDGIVYIVTLSSMPTTADETINAIMASDEKNENCISLSQDDIGILEKDGAHLNVYMSLDMEQDYSTLCTICCIDREEAEKMHYFAFEALIEGDMESANIDPDTYAELFMDIIKSYSEMQILEKYHSSIQTNDLGLTDIEDQTDVTVQETEPTTSNDTSKGAATKDEYSVKDYKGNEIAKAKVPEGFDFEVTESSSGSVSFANEGYYTTIRVSGYADREDIDYIKGIKFDNQSYGYSIYKDVQQIPLDKYETSQGTVYILKYHKVSDNYEADTYKAVLYVNDDIQAQARIDGYYINSDEEAVKILKQIF